MKSSARKFFAFNLAALCLSGGIISTTSAAASDTGIRGTVLIGPGRGGPVRVDEGDEAPFPGAFVVLSAGSEVARFKSDRKGQFEVSLPAGDYTIVPANETPIPAPQSQVKPVTVPVDGFLEVTLVFDTGMR